jgi:hypothetical protein
MIKQFREATGFSKNPSDTMPETTIISFYSYRMRFANHVIGLSKGSNTK